MKLETLNTLWQQKHPEGEIFHSRDFGNGSMGKTGFVVIYSPNSKCYHYKARSVYALAERFNLIPAYPDVDVEARRVMNWLLSGTHQTVTHVAGLADTIRYRLDERGSEYTINSELAGEDEFDRALCAYSLKLRKDCVWSAEYEAS